ncbi:hypothetical protein HPB49_004764 [Dermacentor silvarum]|uniref:Uncharacterized protein n=1 Tax=Dermacentor silvarum TaxID=543639 RepID=A0ACB8DAE9_DERSI|nr:hypothetical protein HPB49_004764 [Dermacentor silvarum]
MWSLAVCREVSIRGGIHDGTVVAGILEEVRIVDRQPPARTSLVVGEPAVFVFSACLLTRRHPPPVAPPSIWPSSDQLDEGSRSDQGASLLVVLVPRPLPPAGLLHPLAASPLLHGLSDVLGLQAGPLRQGPQVFSPLRSSEASSTISTSSSITRSARQPSRDVQVLYLYFPLPHIIRRCETEFRASYGGATWTSRRQSLVRHLEQEHVIRITTRCNKCSFCGEELSLGPPGHACFANGSLEAPTTQARQHSDVQSSPSEEQQASPSRSLPPSVPDPSSGERPTPPSTDTPLYPLPDTPGSTTGNVPGPPDRAATEPDQIAPDDVDDGPPSTHISDTTSLLRDQASTLRSLTREYPAPEGLSKAVFFTILASIVPVLPSVQHKFPHANQLLSFLMKLRVNLAFKDLAYRFDVTPKTISQSFRFLLAAVHHLCKAVIVFPSPQVCHSWLTEKERKNFPKLRAIIDCTEVTVARQAA